MGRTLEELAQFPKDVKRAFGFALREVQRGEMPHGSSPLRQFGQGVFELRDSFEGDAYRAVYAVKLLEAVYVLHVFKKKSKSGRAIPNEDLKRIWTRLKRAREMDSSPGVSDSG